MNLKSRLLETAGRMEDRVPVMKARQEREKRIRFLRDAAERGRSYVFQNCYSEGESLSNDYLIGKGADYSRKGGCIGNATFISGGITGDVLEAPFEMDYGSSNQPLRPNFTSNCVKKALSLLVTSDQYRAIGRLEEAACLIEFSKYFIDNLAGLIGQSEAQRMVHFGTENSQVHTLIYEAIGIRALRLTDKMLNSNIETERAMHIQMAGEMYNLAKNCLEQSQLPIEQVKNPFAEKQLVI